MKGSPKRKVQAQRKFAQGAYIPPSTSNAAPAPVRSEPPAPVREERRNIVHNNLSARGLLDIVSFQSVHNHSSPIVIIERLKPEKEPSTPTSSTNGHGDDADKTPTEQKLDSQPVSPKRPNQPTLRRRLKNQKNIMCYFPPNRPRKLIKRKLITKRKLRTAKQRGTNKPVSNSQLKRPLERTYAESVTTMDRSCSVSVSDWEDDKPLKFLKMQYRNRQNIEPEARVTRASRLNQNKNAAVVTRKEADTVGMITRRKGRDRERISTSSSDKDTTEDVPPAKEPVANKEPVASSSSFKTFKKPAIPARFTRPGRGYKQKYAKHKKTNGAAPVASTSKTFIPRITKVVSIAPEANEPIPSTSKEPTSVQVVSLAPEANVPVPSTSKEPTCVQAITPQTLEGLANHDEVPGPSDQFYGSSGIKRWLNGKKSRRRKTNTSEENKTCCPSDSFSTVDEVINAPENIMSLRCNECRPCTRVKLVEEISRLMKKTKSTSQRLNRPGDVYEFDANDDTSNNLHPPPFFFHRKRKARTQDKERRNKDNNDDAASSDEEDQLLYLDIQKDSPHIIEMTTVRIPNSKKRMMKARLIPRQEAHTTEHVSLVKHESLLDELLQTLTVNVEVMDNSDVQSTIHNEQWAKVEREKSSRLTGKRHYPLFEEVEEFPPPKPSKPENEPAKLVEAPILYPTEEEFKDDPIAYFEKALPIAAKYGMCKVVAPASFKPKCHLNDVLKFNVTNHYIARLFSRWGPAAREICAMRAYLATQNVHFNRVPLLDSIEANLPKLYSVVQRLGGLEQVLDKNRWSKVAEEMCISKEAATEKILDNFYVKYLVPFDTASNQERVSIMSAVEKCWNKRYRKLIEWASNPLHLQKKLMGESDSSEEESTSDLTSKALHEAEDCIVTGRPMCLNGFQKVAINAMAMYMGKEKPTVEEVEKEYWRLVLFGTEHVCVNAASIDTATANYGFSTSKNESEGKHPWNLKVLSHNSNNVLRSIDNVLGVTVPTLHLGMVFSTCCWHRDPHCLPWMEYMHSGAPKIWYGIPEEQSENFRKAVEVLCPTSCQNKYIWLSSDITMIPPNLLLQHNVSLSHTVQNPGEYIIVFPKSYSCSISTGFTVSESVYFANKSWLQTVHQIFQELRLSCEPTAFPLEHLLIAMVKDPRVPFSHLHTVHSSLKTIVDEEIRNRRELAALGLTINARSFGRRRSGQLYNVQDEAECKICRVTLYLSKVTGIISKKTFLCPMHAIRMIDVHKYNKTDISRMELILFYTDKHLEDIMTLLSKRLYP